MRRRLVHAHSSGSKHLYLVTGHRIERNHRSIGNGIAYGNNNLYCNRNIGCGMHKNRNGHTYS